MLADDVSVFNMALESVGARSDVASTAEASREAEVCRLWYPQVRDLVLGAAPWGSATEYSRLALLRTRNDTLQWDGTIDPPPGFIYSHAAPSDMIRPQYLSTYERFRMGSSGNQRIIASQSLTPILVYTKQVINPQIWEHDLGMAIVAALSARICVPLNGKNKRAADLAQESNAFILQARANAANEGNEQLETIPDWISARGANFTGPTIRYFYPFGPMISLTEVAGVA